MDVLPNAGLHYISMVGTSTVLGVLAPAVTPLGKDKGAASNNFIDVTPVVLVSVCIL